MHSRQSVGNEEGGMPPAKPGTTACIGRARRPEHRALMTVAACRAASAKASTLRALWLSRDSASAGAPKQAASRAAPTVPE